MNVWKLKEVIMHLRAECIRIRDHAQFRIHELADKVKMFCSVQRECGMLLEKWEGLCHVEDIMREETVVMETVVTTTDTMVKTSNSEFR
jgi:hypothetical protein